MLAVDWQPAYVAANIDLAAGLRSRRRLISVVAEVLELQRDAEVGALQRGDDRSAGRRASCR